eukprot:snap_masked-scaffold_3-processed-gene-3.46-mRNA-1 protein AED:1.00 eAED:1.00 QI:0/-1/0/0/-1/1/1/0/66
MDHFSRSWRFQDHLLFKQTLLEKGRETFGYDGAIEFKVKVPSLAVVHIPRKREAKCSDLVTACKAL